MTWAEVRLWGRPSAPFRWATATSRAFQYIPPSPAAASRSRPSPCRSATGYTRFPPCRQPRSTLPRLLADSLPDRFGNAVIDAWLSTRAIAGELQRRRAPLLCRQPGIGALEFAPSTGPATRAAKALHVDALVELRRRSCVSGSTGARARRRHSRGRAQRHPPRGHVGGRCPAKAVITWNRETNEVRSGQITADPRSRPAAETAQRRRERDRTLQIQGYTDQTPIRS